ncbi:reverse transcriptase domain-containing protein, partial [Tanacetum coccineum]
KYLVELGAYNITYIPRNTVKGQVLADFLIETLIEVKGRKKEVCNISNEEMAMAVWTLYTERASSKKDAGVRLVLMNPMRLEYTYALCLNFESFNNEAEYEALLVGLKIAQKIKVRALNVKVDSKLVAKQINGEYVAYNKNMVQYLAKAGEHVKAFKNFTIQNIPRNQNQKVDILSKLALVALNHFTKEILVEVSGSPSIGSQEISAIIEEGGDN